VTERRRKRREHDHDHAEAEVRGRVGPTVPLPLPIDRTGRLDAGLARGDAGSRAEAVATLQRLAGNTAVQREAAEAEPTERIEISGIGPVVVESLSWSLVKFSGGTFEEVHFVLGFKETARVGDALREAYATDRTFALVKMPHEVLRGARVMDASGEKQLHVRLKGNLKRKKR
jgi:hypothetical protein